MLEDEAEKAAQKASKAQVKKRLREEERARLAEKKRQEDEEKEAQRAEKKRQDEEKAQKAEAKRREEAEKVRKAEEGGGPLTTMRRKEEISTKWKNTSATPPPATTTGDIQRRRRRWQYQPKYQAIGAAAVGVAKVIKDAEIWIQITVMTIFWISTIIMGLMVYVIWNVQEKTGKEKKRKRKDFWLDSFLG